MQKEAFEDGIKLPFISSQLFNKSLEKSDSSDAVCSIGQKYFGVQLQGNSQTAIMSEIIT